MGRAGARGFGGVLGAEAAGATDVDAAAAGAATTAGDGLATTGSAGPGSKLCVPVDPVFRVEGVLVAGAFAPEVFVVAALPEGEGAALASGGFSAAFSVTFAFGLGFGFLLLAGASRISLGFAPGTAFPPDARSRGTASSGTEEDAVLASNPISSRAAVRSLLLTPSSFASS